MARLLLCFVLLALVLMGCNSSECDNYNPVFDENEITSRAYIEELQDQLSTQKPEDLSFWLADYIKTDDGEHILVIVKGSGLCAKAQLLVTDWSKMQGIRENEAHGYKGAELVGLQFRFHLDENEAYLSYENIEHTLD